MKNYPQNALPNINNISKQYGLLEEKYDADDRLAKLYEKQSYAINQIITAIHT